MESLFPNILKQIKSRISYLNAQISKYGKVDIVDTEVLRQINKDFYTDYRETVERFVEQTLLSSVVQRFEKDVKTMMLSEVEVRDEDYKEIFQIMKKASTYSGHDAPLGAQITPVSVDEMGKDLAKLSNLVTVTNKRKEETRKRRKKMEKPPAGKLA